MRAMNALCALLFIACSMRADVIVLPSLSIAGSTVDSNVTFDSARQVYRYHYTINAAATNKAPITALLVDVSGGRMDRPQLDPDLQNNVERDEATAPPLQPLTTIPVGIIVPEPSRFDGGVGQPAFAFFSSIRGAGDIPAGTTASGFVLESKFPPGVRAARLEPSQISWTRATRSAPKDTEFYPQSGDEYELKTTVIGPSDPDPATLFLGGGQSPAEVNPFLRYAAPAESRSHLPAGTTGFDVVVFYGETTRSSTFTATLNGTDVASRFQPVPGSAQVVHIPLISGTTKLQLSIEGTTSSGRVARDTDTLTFLVP